MRVCSCLNLRRLLTAGIDNVMIMDSAWAALSFFIPGKSGTIQLFPENMFDFMLTFRECYIMIEIDTNKGSR